MTRKGSKSDDEIRNLDPVGLAGLDPVDRFVQRASRPAYADHGATHSNSSTALAILRAGEVDY